jgi:hypothetical protein
MRSQTQAVRQFLAAQRGYVCVACAAGMLDLGIRPVTMITLGLLRSEDFEATDAVCRLCQARGRVIHCRETATAGGSGHPP